MPSRHSTTGLGLEFESPGNGLQSKPYPSDAEVLSRTAGQRVQRRLTGPRAPSQPRPSHRRARSDFRPPSAPPTLHDSATTESVAMRSKKAMEGLERAELGDATVEFDVGGGSMKEGSRFAVEMTPRGGSIPQRSFITPSMTVDDDRTPRTALPRDATLFNFGQSHARNAVELKSLLGDSNARLKSGAAVPPTVAQKALDKKARKEQTVTLEQAKSRARVEVDLVLQSNVYVQGGYVRGHVKVHVRRGRKKEEPVKIAEGKVRIIGFETLPNDDERHVFYQYAVPFASITANSGVLYDSTPGQDGFSLAAQGTHTLPFSFQLPVSSKFGCAKGAISMTSGITVRYIAMVSIKVRDPNTGKRSLAHFYRSCEVWPHLDPSAILRPAARPLHASTAKNISLLGGSSTTKVKLSAQLSRLHWASGTRCPVSLQIHNGSKKTIRSVVLQLIRTTTLFRPRVALDVGSERERDPDACQTATTHKVMAEAFLEMSEGVAKGRASAKGWWAGVGPGQETAFTHYIVLPPEVLSVTRSRLVEVEYSVRVTASAGSLAADVSVTLPVRIFNFVSIDPPVDAGLASDAGAFPRADVGAAGGGGASTSAIYAGSSHSIASDTSSHAGTLPDDYPAPRGSHFSALHVTNPDLPPAEPLASVPSSTSCAVELRPMDSTVSMSMYSADSASGSDGDGDGDGELSASASNALSGVLELDEDAGSDEEVHAVMRSVCVDEGRFTRPVDEAEISAPAPPAKSGKHFGRAGVGIQGIGTGMRMTGFAKRVQEERRRRERRRSSKVVKATQRETRMPLEDDDDEAHEEMEEPDSEEHTPRIAYGHAPASRILDQHASDGGISSSDSAPEHDTSFDVDASYEREYDCSYQSDRSTDEMCPSSAILVHPPRRSGSRQLPRPPSIPPHGSVFPNHGSHEGAHHRPSTISMTGSTDAPTVSALLETLKNQPQHRSSPGGSGNNCAYGKPTHTFHRQPSGRALPNPHAQTRSREPVSGLPMPPSASASMGAYPSDPELLRMAILRPPAGARSRESESGSGSEGGVKGRIAALEERVRTARVTGDAYY